MEESEGRIVGQWRLLEKIGEGRNAAVYRAQRGDEPEVALKLLNATRVHREPYRRFVNEITALQRLAGFPGVLPLLDFSLPEKPSREEPVWLAMPLATPISEALGDAALERVVEAVRDIAMTLPP